MTTAKKNETPRQAYIRLLSETLPSNDCPRDAAILGELITAGYLDGETFCDKDGVVDGAVCLGGTVKGRLFEQELRQQEKESRWQFKFFGYFCVLSGYIAGFLTPIFNDWLRALLGL